MDKKQEACELLYRHWATGTQLEALPDALRPGTRAEGYGVQACIEDFSRQSLYGWKIAATSVNGQRHIGVDGLLCQDDAACSLFLHLFHFNEQPVSCGC
jgi:hypothetical protein